MGNMVFLAAVGVAVEIATGSGRFTLVYFLSGLVGVGLYWMATRRMEDPPALVGASGAIAGCAGYYSLRYTKLRVSLAPKRSASVAFITVLWLLLQLAGAIINIGQPVQASGFFAHLGGAVCGLILGLLLRAPDLGGMKLGHAVLDALNDQGPESQIAHLKAHLIQHPDDVTVQSRLAHEYEELGDKQEEIVIRTKLAFSSSGEIQEQSVLRLLALSALGSISSVRRRQLADQLAPSLAEQVLKTIIDGDVKDPQRPEAMLDLAGRLEENSAKGIAQQLASEYPLHSATEVARQRGWLG